MFSSESETPEGHIIPGADSYKGRRWNSDWFQIGKGWSLVGCRLWGRTESDTTEAT